MKNTEFCFARLSLCLGVSVVRYVFKPYLHSNPAT
jgi:hypothetical protein